MAVGQLKMPSGVLGPAAAVAAADPPTSFDGFRLTPVPPPAGDRVVPWTHFKVACRSCGHDYLHLSSRSVPHGDTRSDDREVGPPHRLKCAQCGETHAIFDPNTDGYDGVLGHHSRIVSEEGGEVFSPQAAKTFVVATYNIALSELQEIAAGATGSVKPSDLFDWINIIQTDPDDPASAWREVDYECA